MMWLAGYYVASYSGMVFNQRIESMTSEINKSIEHPQSTRQTTPSRHKNQQGFSLLEMAVVLVVLGLILGGMLIPLSTQIEKQDRDETKKTLQNIQDALIGYTMTNGRLPCPDTDGDGIIDMAGTCTNAQGTIPWVDLGVGKEDAWGQPFTYRVTGSFADNTDGTGCGTATAGVSFELCSVADINVIDSAAGNPVANLIPAVVIAHGKNWATTTSADENENTDTDTIFVDRRPSMKTAPTFDDQVIWISSNILKTKLVTAGRLP
ncbi:MAG: prepilin-type N-terminal cleavage/methylation domain-containing protein [Porticoccus sp.]|nr:prepilin-type N-terminal cleavage/methylation domain-containing protein [Porticoccus sp.]